MSAELFVGLALVTVGAFVILCPDRVTSSSYVQRRRDAIREWGVWYPSEQLERRIYRAFGVVFVLIGIVLAFGWLVAQY